MPLEETLRKVEYDISRGDYEKARQRLTGLLCHFAYPMNLQVRRMLGDIHWRMGNVIEAGRYWYLEEHKTPEMTTACQRYEKACGNSPQQIGRRLKLYGDIAELRKTSPYAFHLFESLKNEAWNEFEDRYPFGGYWNSSHSYMPAPRTNHILVVDATELLWPVALALTDWGNVYPELREYPHQMKYFGPEKVISVVSQNYQRLQQLEDETQTGKINVVDANYSDLDELDKRLDEATGKYGVFETALVWIPGATTSTHEVIAKHVRGKYYHILGSGVGNPETNITTPFATLQKLETVGYYQIIIGWVYEQGKSRWQSPAEIARGISDALRYGHIRWKIGTIKPWSDRPTQPSPVD